MKTRLIATIAFSALAALVSGCSADIDPGSQLAGQQCFKATDCSSGLICYQRTCVPQNPYADTNNLNGLNNVNSANSANSANSSNSVNNVNAANGGNNVNAANNVNNVEDCQPGEQRCIDGATFYYCVANPDGTTTPVLEDCPPTTICENGECLPIDPEQCVDRDNDGFGSGCEGALDCDDSNPRVNPGVPEFCDTPFDDNCNGVVNEGCAETCCPNGCGADEYCTTECACQAYDPQICAYPNQPCEQEGAFINGYVCASIDGQSQPRCFGVCDQTSDDPDSTCPDEGQVCSFGENGNGICLSACNNGEPCGEPDLGCLSIDGGPEGGVCVPADPNKPVGASCNPDVFFDCAAGAACIPNEFGGGTCRETCRPFAFVSTADGATDCETGHCLPVAPNIGLCFEDNGSTEGEQCSPQNTACGEDAVGCYPSFQGGTRCQRLCRLAEGGTDCAQGQSCRRFSMEGELGVCR